MGLIHISYTAWVELNTIPANILTFCQGTVIKHKIMVIP